MRFPLGTSGIGTSNPQFKSSLGNYDYQRELEVTGHLSALLHDRSAVDKVWKYSFFSIFPFSENFPLIYKEWALASIVLVSDFLIGHGDLTKRRHLA